MKAENLDIKGCVALGGAIVARAGLDYLRIRRELEGLDAGCKRNKLEVELEDIETFFKSRWYRDLTEVNGEFFKESLDNYFEELKKAGKLEEIDNVKIMEP